MRNGYELTANISPIAMKLYNDYRLMDTTCTIEFNGDYGYEVKDGNDWHTVNLELKKCTCRLSYLDEKPCHRVIKTLMYKKLIHRKMSVTDHAQAMEPPEVVKLVGRSKMKRSTKSDE
ncbi:hypothetical protein HAX54_037678, partial [Datura stramonium]|nr:hypothetical protein [Datura stramonium]